MLHGGPGESTQALNVAKFRGTYTLPTHLLPLEPLVFLVAQTLQLLVELEIIALLIAAVAV